MYGSRSRYGKDDKEGAEVAHPKDKSEEGSAAGSEEEEASNDSAGEEGDYDEQLGKVSTSNTGGNRRGKHCERKTYLGRCLDNK